MNMAAGQMPNQRQPGAPQMGQQLPNSNPGNQPLSHLQRPMQASPIPMPGSNGLVPQMPQQQPAMQLQGQMPLMQMQQRGVTPQALAQVTNELMSKATPDQVAAGERHFASMPMEKQQLIRSQNFPAHYAYFRELAFKFMSERQQSVMQNQAMQQGMGLGQRPPNPAPGQELNYPSFAGQHINNPQQNTAQQLSMPGNNSFQMRGIGMPPNPINGMTQGQGQAGAPAMNRQPSNAQMEQMRAQNQQQQQLAAQMAQHRETMSMMGQMSSAGGNPMLAQSVSQPQQQQGIPRHPTAQMTPQQQNAMAMGMNMQQQQVGAGMPGASPERMMQAQARLQHIPQGLPQEVRQRLLQLPEDQFREHIRRLRATAGMGPGGAGNPMGQLAQAAQLNLQQNRSQLGIPPQFATPGQGQIAQGVPNPGQGQLNNPQGAMPSQIGGITPNMIIQLDQREFPRGVLAANKLLVPESVRTWGDLKQWLSQNQSAVPSLNQAQLLKIQLQCAHAGLKNQGIALPGGVAPGHPGLAAQGRIPVQQSMLQVSPDEINAVRSRPGYQNRSDDDIRRVVQQLKMNQLRKMQMNGQLGVPGAPQPQQQQPPMFLQQSPPAPQPVQAQQPPPQAERMRKRPSSEAFEEGPETQTAPAVQHPTASLPGGGIAAALRTPVQTSGAKPAPKTQDDASRILQDLYQRVKAELKLPTKPLQVSPGARKQYVDALKPLHLPMIDTFIKTMYMATGSIADTKENMKARLLVIHNADRESGQLFDTITVPWPDFKAATDRCRAVMESYQRLRGGVKPQPQPSTTQSPPQAGHPQKRGNAKAPPAPTAAPGQNPFFPSGAASPSAAQQYFDQIKPPDLRLPASKRAKKTGTSSPPAPTAAAKAAVAHAKVEPARTEPAPKADPKPFKCPSHGCEFSQRGFESQALLDEHKHQLHSNFSQDPAKHVTDIVAGVLLGNGVKKEDNTKTTPKGSPANVRKTSPKGSPALGGLRNTPQQKTAPTSAPKNETREIKEEDDPWKHAGMSADDLRETFNIEAFSAADHALLYGVDSSPSALTPSSSKDSSSTGSSTREATDALLAEPAGKRALNANDPAGLTMDPASMLVLTENLSLDFGSGVGALEALDDGGIEALIEQGIDGFKGLEGLQGDLSMDGLGDGIFGDDMMAVGSRGLAASGETVDLMDWTNLFGNDGGDDPYAIPGWAQDPKETTL
jgi:hypothetical protein